MSIQSISASVPPPPDNNPAQRANAQAAAQAANQSAQGGQGVQNAQGPQSSNAAESANASRAASEPRTDQNIDRETLLQAVEEVRSAIAPVAQNLLFSIDNDTGRTVVKVVDSSTDEVIRQIPSEELLAISKAMDKLQGVLIKQEV